MHARRTSYLPSCLAGKKTGITGRILRVMISGIADLDIAAADYISTLSLIRVYPIP